MAPKKTAASTTQPTKAPARKKTTKRGPTKATALKALGLTQEDLDTLKELKEVRAAVEKSRAEAETPPVDPVVGTESNPVYVAPDEDTQKEAQVGPFYVRNLRYVDVSFRLSRQQESGKKRTELRPRGQRNDLQKLQPEDLNDSALISQVEIGLVEIITAAEARKAIEKQNVNTKQSVHPAIALLRNPKGEEYEQQNIKTEAEFNSQGVTVAQLKPVAGGYGELEVNRGGIVREQQGSIGGNPHIISDGFAVPANSQLGSNAAAAAADAVARQKNLDGPAAGLGGLQVTVAPTEKA